MSCTAFVSRTAVLSSMCLTLLMGNSATATLLLSEQLAVSAYSGAGITLSPFSENALLDDDLDSWNAGWNANPAIEFEFIQSYNIDRFLLNVIQNTDEPVRSELQFSITPLQNDWADTKATYLASQLVASNDFAREINQLANQTVHFRQSNYRLNSSVSLVKKVEISIYSTLALFALGAVGWNVVHWNQRRQKIKEFERFSSIAEADLLMARLPLGAPSPGARAELESPDPANSGPHARPSDIR
jgi:hypothetical protein